MRRRSGVTVLEAMIALAIIGLAVVSALSSFGAQLRGAARAREALPAVALAEDRLAAIALLDPVLVRTLPDSLARGTVAAPLDAYRWTAETRALTAEPDLVEARVVVRWADGRYDLAARFHRPLRAERGR